MNNVRKMIAAVLLVSLVGASPIFAADVAVPLAAEKPEAVIKRTLESSRSDVKVIAVSASEISGLYAVQIEGGPTVYATPDGKYFVLGDLFQVKEKGFVNLAEQKRNGERAKAIAAVKPEDTIAFKPKGEPKAIINVFTDVDCPWCQKFHQQVPQLNAMGIEVRYLAYPRAGIGSEAYQKLVTAWCAKDRQGTLTKFKKGEAVAISTCAKNPVSAQYELGERIGVNGTPALVTMKGELMPGFVPAEQLAQTLGVH